MTANDTNIDIYTFHYAHPDVVNMNYELNKPIGFNETGFAGKSDATYRRQAWRFMMRGGGLFNHLDYSYSVGNEKGTDSNYQAPGGGSPALRQQFKVLKNFIEQFDLNTFRPDDRFVGHVEGAFAYAMRDAKQFAVYLEPLFAQVAAKVPLKLPKGDYQLSWMEAATGKVWTTERIKIATSTQNPLIVNSPLDGEEKVLIIKKLSRK
ncbi:MAG: hypothetical protein HC892_03620 [Saprospiraceae bacterium]|nr:hypothetical protein [Saprospiraceae bacterium]